MNCLGGTFSLNGICTKCRDSNAATCTALLALSWCVQFVVLSVVSLCSNVMADDNILAPIDSNSPFNLDVDGTCVMTCSGTSYAVNGVCLVCADVNAMSCQTSSTLW